jgi:tripartite-type tricarboxylate transporter receptor subunit TctC
VIVPAAAGGSTDILARTVAQVLNDTWRQPVIAENRPGAAFAIGSELLVRSAPDGHTLMVGTVTSHAVAATLYPKLPYDVQRDFAPVTEIAHIPQFLSVHPSMPVKSVQDLVALAKARPGQINYGAGSVGATQHMSTELFQTTAGIKMIPVQYRGSGPAMIGLLGGEVQVMFDVVMTTLPHMRSGKLRTVGVTSPRRVAVAPQVPTIAESGYPGFEALVWFGLFAPAATPADIVKKIQEAVTAGLSTPKMKAHLTEQGLEVVAGTPDAFAKRIAAEIVKWRKVIQSAGIRAQL